MADLVLMPDDEYEPIKARLLERLGSVLILNAVGDITPDKRDAEMDRLKVMLSLIPDPDVQARDPRGHLKGVRGRAVPTFDKRRGAVGA